ncbi:glutamate-rich protein 1 isoform X1 [Anoplopoma fimbria]|uniref:glutamate-rich protein 1 isoform X1 n=1 Tax=Anoplopoma fimbria TaxID=229290 RepID=UPI0023EA8BFC|nr:glutamate-rich protein 1 isoform X1 [Anoplopoma fimbria]
MAGRKEVFQSKVLQKLYPEAAKPEKEPSPPSIVEALSRKSHVKRKASQQDTAIGDAGTTHSAANPGKRMYTALPPPADYKTDSEKSVTLPQLESINSAEDPAGALLKYFGASSATGGQDEPPTSPARQDSAEDQDEEEQPSTSSATHSGMVLTLQDEPPSMSSAVSPQISDIEDEDLFASRPTSPQHEPSETPGAEPPLSPTEDEPLSTDPASWPSPLTDRIRTELVRRGPKESVHDTNEESDPDKEEEEQKRKRKRRKKKPALHQNSRKGDAAPVSESSTGQSRTPEDEGGEHISKNKKRKLKKKRHKEKLLSMGLMPRATALEFTYRKDGEEEEEDEDDNNKRRAAEVSEFLRTTMEIYMSDSSVRADHRPLLSGTVNDLLSSIASGCLPPAVLKQLSGLKAFVQQQQADKLEKALGELFHTSPMSAEETAAVVSLFQYWITDILPMQGEKKTAFSDAPMRQ